LDFSKLMKKYSKWINLSGKETYIRDHKKNKEEKSLAKVIMKIGKVVKKIRWVEEKRSNEKNISNIKNEPEPSLVNKS